MKKILLLLCLCLFIEEVASRELDKTFQLLPQPQSGYKMGRNRYD
jgi:hexosaminidase